MEITLQRFAVATAKSSPIRFLARHVRARKHCSAYQCAQRARAAGRKPQNKTHTFSIGKRLGFHKLFFVPVVVHVLDVVVILEHVDELLHVLDVAGVGQLDVVLGDHLHLCGGEITTFRAGML